jgi:hypothetical protein
MPLRAQALAIAGASLALAATPIAFAADKAGRQAATATAARPADALPGAVAGEEKASASPPRAPVREIAGDLRTYELGVELGDDPGIRGIAWSGELHLPPEADVDPATCAFRVSLASGAYPAFETTLQPGALTRRSETVYRFESTLPSGSRLAVRLRATNDGVWDFRIAADRVAVLLSNHRALTAGLAIGDAAAAESVPLDDHGDRLSYQRTIASAAAVPESESAIWTPDAGGLTSEGTADAAVTRSHTARDSTSGAAPPPQPAVPSTPPASRATSGPVPAAALVPAALAAR